jgi:hypothetical protein
MRSASIVPGQCYRYIGKADVQNPVFTYTEGPQMAVSRLMHCSITVCYCRPRRTAGIDPSWSFTTLSSSVRDGSKTGHSTPAV